jgi:hypothetical protein
VFNQAYFNVGNFPANMPTIWDAQWGYVKTQMGLTIVVGEWGGDLILLHLYLFIMLILGKYGAGTKDRTWQDAFANYLIEKCMQVHKEIIIIN